MLNKAILLGSTATRIGFANADEVQVAVAANFTAPMLQIAAHSEKETDDKAKAIGYGLR